MTDEKHHFEKVISAAIELQKIYPEAVLVGGTAVALYTHHRYSMDADHVLNHLKDSFNNVLNHLNSLNEWKTARINKPVQILGSFNGIETGLRQLIRTKPLETFNMETPFGMVQIPIKQELLRIKALLCVKRNATRDFVDFVALAETMTNNEIYQSLECMNDYYKVIPNTVELPFLSVILQLAEANPNDLNEDDLTHYKGLVNPYNEWSYIKDQCLNYSVLLSNSTLDNTNETSPC